MSSSFRMIPLVLVRLIAVPKSQDPLVAFVLVTLVHLAFETTGKGGTTRRTSPQLMIWKVKKKSRSRRSATSSEETATLPVVQVIVIVELLVKEEERPSG